ncbi:MAG: hypothetical protein QG570_236 [Patescibacteria group bacterium]|nr:hypothetical protein [Patescibacteria group bacterium]
MSNKFETPSLNNDETVGDSLENFRREIESKKNDPENTTAHFKDLHNTEYLTMDDMKMNDEFKRLMNAPYGTLVDEDYDRLSYDFRLYVTDLEAKKDKLTQEEYESRRAFLAYLSNILGGVLLKIKKEKK